MTTAPPLRQEEAPKKLPATVVALGWVSLLTDAASDMIYPLVPELLRQIGGGPLWLGWFEGVAELVATSMKVVSGRLSDEPRRRKPLIALGYGLAALTRPLFAVVSAPLHAVLIRAIDRVGKGMRGPPRDAMVAGAVPEGQRGHAFGFHRMMDNFGGVLGPILAFLLLWGLHLPLRTVFALAVVPGLAAVLVVLLFVRDPALDAATPREDEGPTKQAAANAGPTKIPAEAWRYLAALFVFSLACSGDLFLLRRMSDLGLSPAFVPIVWISLQFGKGLLNVPGGRASDRYGRKRVLALSWVLYGITYVGFGFATSWIGAWVWLGLYAAHYGLAEGGQRALLAELVPASIRGRAFGYQLAIEGAAVLLANVLFGLAYERASAPVAFAAAGAVALVGALLLLLLVKASPKNTKASA
ncbi:MFS transporter [Polyangium sp. y55x31]|uniref:MFS transporter n=1 Tax=Polyangium sp. y55x31 TaxID=3042688 RepID=UPI002482D6C3|nr:MFS transporter [Polyangium sp. y55x31]MDI1482817.1 MFS transporter [Polyangium sp. y55x31]